MSFSYRHFLYGKNKNKKLVWLLVTQEKNFYLVWNRTMNLFIEVKEGYKGLFKIFWVLNKIKLGKEKMCI